MSGGVARKEHGEFSSNIDLIDVLPPGLYEAMFERKSADTANPDLTTGDWVMRCEARTLDDIRALGGNDAADERRFATAARVSEINLALYRTFAQPLVRAMVNSPMAEWLQQLHPLRLQYELFSDANPLMAWVGTLAEQVREDRKPAAADNPLLAVQETVSRQIVEALDRWRDMNEALVGADVPHDLRRAEPAGRGRHRSGRQSSRRARRRRTCCIANCWQSRIAELKKRMSAGGLREAMIRGLLYVGMSRAAVDERGFEMVRRIRQENDAVPLSEFKAMVREQFFMLLIDQEAALAAIPAMLPADPKVRQQALAIIRQVLAARGELSDEDKARLAQVTRLFGAGCRHRAQSFSPAAP